MILSQHAKQKQVRVLVDAEYTYMNPALSLVTMAMMAQCNREEPWIWNTYQGYLKVLYSPPSKWSMRQISVTIHTLLLLQGNEMENMIGFSTPPPPLS